jgi:hypothetical protein
VINSWREGALTLILKNQMPVEYNHGIILEFFREKRSSQYIHAWIDAVNEYLKSRGLKNVPVIVDIGDVSPLMHDYPDYGGAEFVYSSYFMKSYITHKYHHDLQKDLSHYTDNPDQVLYLPGKVSKFWRFEFLEIMLSDNFLKEKLIYTVNIVDDDFFWQETYRYYMLYAKYYGNRFAQYDTLLSQDQLRDRLVKFTSIQDSDVAERMYDITEKDFWNAHRKETVNDTVYNLKYGGWQHTLPGIVYPLSFVKNTLFRAITESSPDTTSEKTWSNLFYQKPFLHLDQDQEIRQFHIDRYKIAYYSDHFSISTDNIVPSVKDFYEFCRTETTLVNQIKTHNFKQINELGLEMENQWISLIGAEEYHKHKDTLFSVYNP